MRTIVLALGIIATTLTAASAADKMRPDDEKAIQQGVDAFVKAYNAHDAKAIAALFTEEGVTAGEEGNVSKGRAAIEKTFAGVFQDHPKTRIENTIESIRFVGPAEAIENGLTTITNDKDSPAEKNRYRVVHVKRDGKWQMASAIDLPEDAWTGEDQLKQLEGLIGDWIDESPDALVITSYHWTDNHRFILGTFTVQTGGKPAMTGTIRIGWDPLKKIIRSWVFDSEGGLGEGVWTLDDKKWTVKATGVTRDGKPASSTRVITPINKHRLMVQTVACTVGDKKMPDGQKLIMVRRPPTPK
jgi:uncharacterized protein (TIGR02246 family)